MDTPAFSTGEELSAMSVSGFSSLFIRVFRKLW